MKQALLGRVFAFALGTAATVSIAAPAFAEETWLACAGNVVTTPLNGGDPTGTQASARTLVLDDAQSEIYQYSEKRKALDIMHKKSYTPDTITWGANMQHTGGMRWEGSLDRKNMSVKIVRDDSETRMTWNEKCAPSSPAESQQVASTP